MKADPGRPARDLRTGERGTAYPLFRDAHVHLGLIDPSGLPESGIGAVVDLGWSPDVVELTARAPVEVAYAGRFLTAAGGYPSDRQWAPADSTVGVTLESAADAVDAQLALGASVIKVALNSAAGPVPDAATLTAITAASPVPVVAHVEGQGAFEAALAAGVDVLAHTPWTGRLTDRQIEAAAAAGQVWISTLDIHGYGERSPATETALDNLRRFHGAGGRVLYGTDLGNGPLPVGLNLRELGLLRGAGLDDGEIIAALTTPWPVPSPGPVSGPMSEDARSFVPGDRAEDLLDRLARARVVPTASLA